MSLRIGLAGLGIHGQRYARHLLNGDVEGAVLTAVCRRDPAAGSAFAAEHELQYFESAESMAASPTVDAVVLCLPPDAHAPAARVCLEAGKPVLVEKPLAADRAGGLEVIEALDRTGGFLMLGQTLRFDPLVHRLKQEASRLGPVRHLALNQRFEPTTRGWIDEPGRGGILLNTGVHGFDLMRHLTGCEPESIDADCVRTVTTRTPDQFVATLRLQPGNLLATIDNVRSSHSRSGRIEIICEKGQLWGDHIHRTFVRVEGNRITDLGPVAPTPTLPATVQAFTQAVWKQTPPPVTAADGLIVLEVVEAAERSYEQGRRVRLEEVRS